MNRDERSSAQRVMIMTRRPLRGTQKTNQVLVVVSNIFQQAAVFLGPLLIDDSLTLVVPPLLSLINRSFEWLEYGSLI
jgi:hypothetical protein